MMLFKKHSGIYTLYTEQTLNISLEEAWSFFSDPKNLAKITPPKMGFEITSEVDKTAYPGQIITYNIGVLPGVLQSWVTEITEVKRHEFFIDEQRFGSYKMWHHEHFFERLFNGKTLMRDKVSYKLPFGFLGRLAHRVYVKNELKTIFNYRFSILEARFNGE
ncbi:SRPBCC family protein [Tamlana sp. 2_MG-2023]|uniref:SRPBCC family protein n=1 Tax=unclassified Tamlana TaxID=2614803 RepID=UPI0026E2EF0B|nr:MULTISPECIES: SRPBCC family protein [unclassified Tamlana]MDO6759215.1 SRPBCC family protein [Tamlana sp. 2_MG-2023]MDO6790646.1 SRPBCC family protein [Tamlana sp. 1_MG-2023]